MCAEAWPRAGVEEALARRGPPTSKGLTIAPRPAQVLAAEENVDFRIHVENQTRARDDVSRKQLRLYQLYSRTSGKHIQVLGRRISARGEDGDKYGRCQPPPAPACTRCPTSENSGSNPSSARSWLCDLAPDMEPSWASVSSSVKWGYGGASLRASLGGLTEEVNKKCLCW